MLQLGATLQIVAVLQLELPAVFIQKLVDTLRFATQL